MKVPCWAERGRGSETTDLLWSQLCDIGNERTHGIHLQTRSMPRGAHTWWGRYRQSEERTHKSRVCVREKQRVAQTKALNFYALTIKFSLKLNTKQGKVMLPRGTEIILPQQTTVDPLKWTQGDDGGGCVGLCRSETRGLGSIPRLAAENTGYISFMMIKKKRPLINNWYPVSTL